MAIGLTPVKLDPKSGNYDTELAELNQFLAELQQLTQGEPHDSPLRQSAVDAIKVVDCLRFIKVNLAEDGFIRFAFLNRDNTDTIIRPFMCMPLITKTGCYVT